MELNFRLSYCSEGPGTTDAYKPPAFAFMVVRAIGGWVES